MLGHLRDGSQLYQDQPFDTVLAVCRAFVEPLLPTVPKPNRQVYSLSVFRNELWLTEQLVHFTRFAHRYSLALTPIRCVQSSNRFIFSSPPTPISAVLLIGWTEILSILLVIFDTNRINSII